MGVHGLWDLLAPVGRRVSVETLAGRRLAIDASIWMIQFMKAMRDDKGEMIRNAHLVGFFRRICKLLFLRTKPVFVFDGGTPALKRRTVIARRRQRENAQAKIRKVAEKLLLNQLKAARLKELAESLETQKLANSKGKQVASDKPDSLETTGTNGSRDEDYLVKGGGFCADEDEVEADEAQWSSLNRDGTTCDPVTNRLQAVCSFEDVDMNQNEHEFDPSVTASDASKTAKSSLCFSEAKMGEDNSIEGKLIKSSGRLIGVVLREQLSEENQEDQPLIPNDHNTKRDKHKRGKSKNDGRTGSKVSRTVSNLRRSKRTGSSH